LAGLDREGLVTAAEQVGGGAKGEEGATEAAWVEDVYPLTPLQEGMLFEHLAREDDLYVLQSSTGLQGPLDPSALEAAWHAVLRRHGVLRTAFAYRDLVRPMQVVLRSTGFRISQEDWSSRAPEAQAADLEAWLRRDRRRGYDLTRAPLLRCTLVRLGPDYHRLLWSTHHLLLDGWSLPLILQDLMIYYDAQIKGRAVELPPAPRYRDYVAWLELRDREEGLAFWRRELAGMGEPTPLDVGAGRSGAWQKVVSRSHGWAIPAPVTEALKSLARRHGLTLNALLETVWGVLLWHLSGYRDVVFGAIGSGRPPDLPGVERMVGLFISTLPVRLQLDVGAPLPAVAVGLQRCRVEARQFEYLSVAELRKLTEVPADQPLFHSAVAFQNAPVDEALAEQVAGELRLVEGAQLEDAVFPLIWVVEPAGVLRCELQFQQPRFDAATVQRLAGCLTTLLSALAEDEERPIHRLPLLTAAERTQLLQGSRGPEVPMPSLALQDLVWAQARRSPEAAAILAGDECWTFAEVAAEAGALAAKIRTLGLAPGTPVGLWAGRSPALVIGMLGILEAGCAYLPLDPDYPEERLEFMVRDAALPLLVVAPGPAPSVGGDLP
jgi:hypothetical protein